MFKLHLASRLPGSRSLRLVFLDDLDVFIDKMFFLLNLVDLLAHLGLEFRLDSGLNLRLVGLLLLTFSFLAPATHGISLLG